MRDVTIRYSVFVCNRFVNSLIDCVCVCVVLLCRKALVSVPWNLDWCSEGPESLWLSQVTYRPAGCSMAVHLFHASCRIGIKPPRHPFSWVAEWAPVRGSGYVSPGQCALVFFQSRPEDASTAFCRRLKWALSGGAPLAGSQWCTWVWGIPVVWGLKRRLDPEGSVEGNRWEGQRWETFRFYFHCWM